MDQFKSMIVQRLIEVTGNIIAGQLSKPDYESRERNIEQYYERLTPRTAKPKPITEEPISSSEIETKTDNLIEQVCTGLTGEEKQKCEEAVREFVRDPKSMEKYLSPEAKAGF